MDNNKLLGGVTPLKKRQGNRGGKAAGAATATGKQRGGFAKASGGSGGRNVAGYNVNTRFKAEPWQAPPGSSSAPAPKPAVVVDKKTGDVITNNYNYGGNAEASASASANASSNSETTKTTGSPEEGYWENIYGKGIGTWDYSKEGVNKGKLPTWAQAWDLNLEDINNKYDSFDDYVAKRKSSTGGNSNYKRPKYNPGGEVVTGRRWVKTKDKTADSSTSSSSSTSESNSNASASSGGKFTMRAHPFYRNYGIGGEPKKK